MPDSKENLAKALAELDETTTKGLADLANDNPELLRELLEDFGYLPTENAEGTTSRTSATLSPPQKQLRDALEGMGSPRTADEVVELLKTEHDDLIQEYQSAKHRPWISTKLNELVESGSLGRFRDGRVVRYTTTPTEAVRHWALHNNRFVENLERSDAKDIAEDTGMPLRVAREALDEIIQET